MGEIDSVSPALDRWAMSLLSEDPELLRLARRVAVAAGAPVVGGIAVFLHGYRRTTEDIDLHADDTRRISDALTGIGAVWNADAREFTFDGVPVHLVTESQTGGPPRELVEIRGVPTVSLADLVRFKLHSGLERSDRAQDIADVVELARRVPLDKSFAAKLPTEQRAAFKRLVESIER